MRTAIILTFLALTSLPATAERLYVHMTATERDDRVTVEMTLPFRFVSKAADILSRADLRGDCHIRIDHHDFDIDDMREIAAALRRGDEGLLTLSYDEEVRFRRVDDQIEIVAEDDWDRVVTRMPAELFLAAFRDEDGIDFGAALRILASRGGGELLASTADDGSVRVWVDRDKAIGGGER